MDQGAELSKERAIARGFQVGAEIKVIRVGVKIPKEMTMPHPWAMPVICASL
jgi:hypothetical protein